MTMAQVESRTSALFSAFLGLIFAIMILTSSNFTVCQKLCYFIKK